MNVLLDTATWINAVKEPETLPARALNILRDETNSFFLSDISLLEASVLSRKGRVDLGMTFGQWLEKALAATLQVVPISARVAAAENGLSRKFHGDPADRIIAGTAIAHELTLLTPDRRIAFHHVCRTIRYKWPKSRKGKQGIT
ncbi:MAG: type II toxin-antitoxin system VapC family toxin [Acidobacteria bacterium]|nr:type II toxin-antitoxin system VapC family toxin [Acidobacteriota bacterium]